MYPLVRGVYLGIQHRCQAGPNENRDILHVALRIQREDLAHLVVWEAETHIDGWFAGVHRPPISRVGAEQRRRRKLGHGDRLSTPLSEAHTNNRCVQLKEDQSG